MTLLLIISQALLYFCFSILLGSFIVQAIPDGYKPTVTIKRKWLVFSTMAIPLLTFMPILQVVLILQPQFGFFTSLANVLISYKIGFAWDMTLLLAIVLLIYLKIFNNHRSVWFSVFGVVQAVLLIASVAWASHASTLEPLLGFIFDFTHLLSVSV